MQLGPNKWMQLVLVLFVLLAQLDLSFRFICLYSTGTRVQHWTYFFAKMWPELASKWRKLFSDQPLISSLVIAATKRYKFSIKQCEELRILFITKINCPFCRFEFEAQHAFFEYPPVSLIFFVKSHSHSPATAITIYSWQHLSILFFLVLTWHDMSHVLRVITAMIIMWEFLSFIITGTGSNTTNLPLPYR